MVRSSANSGMALNIMIKQGLRWLLCFMAWAGLAVRGYSAPDVAPVVKANNALAIDLYERLAKEPGNFFFSPLSINAALSMVRFGARGETAEQMDRVLHLAGVDTNSPGQFNALMKELNAVNQFPGARLSVVNSLWAQANYPIFDSYKQAVQDNYLASIFQYDKDQPLETNRRINQWVADQTDGKIRNLVPPRYPNGVTRLFLVNAVWFKAGWGIPFQAKLTRDANFYVSSAKTVLVPTMQVEDEFEYYEGADFRALELPYSAYTTSLTIFLPKVNGSWPDIKQCLGTAPVGRGQAISEERRVNVALPRFKLESSFDLQQTMEDLGMRDAFSEGDADFSGITTAKPFFVQAILHKAYVNVDEKGTEAVAASSGMLTDGDIPPPTIDFKVDHPFVFVIRDTTTGVILFMGRVVNPLE